MTTTQRASLACLYAGAVWGVFWYPLKVLENSGISGVWATAVYFFVSAVAVSPVLVKRARQLAEAGIPLQLTCIMSGSALVLYSTSVVFTDVLRAILLFYLMPVWSALLARYFLNEPVTRVRLAALCCAIAGILVMFGLGEKLPIPNNIGDWIGLSAGLLWAIAMVRLRLYPEHNAIDLTSVFFFWSFVLSLLIALMVAPTQAPTFELISLNLPLLIGFVVLLVIPGAYASLQGPKFLNPAVAGLLFMSEIVVGAITVALYTGEPFTYRELAGITLIGTASLIEPLLVLVRGRANR